MVDNLRVGLPTVARATVATRERRLEAPPGFEPGMEVLQTSALPLGDGAPLTLRNGPPKGGPYVRGLYEGDGLSGPEGPDNSVRQDEDGQNS